MDWWLLTFFLGAILSLFLPIVPVLFQLFLLVILLIAFFYHKRLRSSAGLWFGVLWLFFNAYSLNQNISADLTSAMQDKQVVMITGQVMTLSPLNEDSRKNTRSKSQNVSSVKFNFTVSKVNHKEVNKPFMVRLNGGKALTSAKQGQVLTLKVKLKPAHGLANLGSFNYQAWLKSKNIVATGYVINKKENALESSLILNSLSVRQKIFNKYQQLILSAKLNRHELVPLIYALTFGERSQLTKEQWEVLQATGTGHLIAISGLHIGLVASGSYFFVMLLIRLLPLSIFIQHTGKLLNSNSRYGAIFISISLALFYGFLAGFSLPTQRAIVMLLIYWLARFLLIHLSIKRWFLLTIFTLILMNPFSLLTASFWLSTYAVSIIFLTLWRFRFYLKQGNTFLQFFKGLLVIQLSLTLMLLPISALFFQQLSVVALFANIIAVPWMSFISIPCALLSVLMMPINELVGQFFAKGCLESISVLWPYLTFLADQPFAQQSVSQGDQILIFIITLIIFIMIFISPPMTIITLIYRYFRTIILTARAVNLRLALISFIGISLAGGKVYSFFISPSNTQEQNTQEQKEINVQPNVWKLHLFDVGQGLSILISQNNRALLYDTGAAYPSGFNMVESVVLPYLQYAGIEHLDKVFLSHSDNDHAGGITQLLSGIKVKKLITNDSKLAQKHSTIKPCYQGMSFHWQSLTIEALWPQKIEIEADENKRLSQKYRKQGNDDSCVLLISDGKHSVLLTGDISKKVERELLLHYPKLTADVLVVPHHGSKSSSSIEFIEQLSPDIALVSAGFLNRWSMPVNEVVERYEQQDVRLINSSDKGQIVLTITENILVENYHDDFRPYWFNR